MGRGVLGDGGGGAGYGKGECRGGGGCGGGAGCSPGCMPGVSGRRNGLLLQNRPGTEIGQTDQGPAFVPAAAHAAIPAITPATNPPFYPTRTAGRTAPLLPPSCAPLLPPRSVGLPRFKSTTTQGGPLPLSGSKSQGGTAHLPHLICEPRPRQRAGDALGGAAGGGGGGGGRGLTSASLQRFKRHGRRTQNRHVRQPWFGWEGPARLLQKLGPKGERAATEGGGGVEAGCQGSGAWAGIRLQRIARRRSGKDVVQRCQGMRAGQASTSSTCASAESSAIANGARSSQKTTRSGSASAASSSAAMERGSTRTAEAAVSA
eukprot:scaffold8490_cov64-Isochrysis_galbana.AAC.1